MPDATVEFSLYVKVGDKMIEIKLPSDMLKDINKICDRENLEIDVVIKKLLEKSILLDKS